MPNVHAIGIHPMNEKWKKMKAVHEACKLAEIPSPPQVDKFFERMDPDADGAEIVLTNTPACDFYHGEKGPGLQIDLSKLPEGVTKIRFFLS